MALSLTMVFGMSAVVSAADDAAFDQMWDDMCNKLDGFGFQDLVTFDTNKYTPVIEARKAAK